MIKTCLFCGKKLSGRADKKYCDDTCRNGYNNQKNSTVNKIIRSVNSILKNNRRILTEILDEDFETKKVQKQSLIKKGFNFDYFTHQYTTQKGKKYNFVYDLGYLDLGQDWLLIVQKNE